MQGAVACCQDILGLEPRRHGQALRARGIEFEFQDHDAAHSIQLLDPDGHQVEITTYEPGEA